MKFLIRLISYYFTFFLFFVSNSYSLTITKGPYLQNVQKTGITIMWETNYLSKGKVCYKKIIKQKSDWKCKISDKKVKIQALSQLSLKENTYPK